MYIYYVCKACKLYATDCSQRLSYRADVVDALTWDWVRSIVSDPERLHANLDDYQRQQKQAAQSKLDRLEIIAAFRFPVHVLTKSDLVLRDADILQTIQQETSAVVSFTITTPDDALARQVEPGAPSPSARFAAMASLAGRGIRTGVVLMPVLLFIEDAPQAIAEIVARAHDCGASHVIASFGMTLRDRQREHYYQELDRRFPGLSLRYQQAFGERYFAPVDGAAQLEALFEELIDHYGLQRQVAPYESVQVKQLGLF